jgi:hypothetical protein
MRPTLEASGLDRTGLQGMCRCSSVAPTATDRQEDRL